MPAMAAASTPPPITPELVTYKFLMGVLIVSRFPPMAGQDRRWSRLSSTRSGQKWQASLPAGGCVLSQSRDDLSSGVDHFVGKGVLTLGIPFEVKV